MGLSTASSDLFQQREPTYINIDMTRSFYFQVNNNVWCILLHKYCPIIIVNKLTKS